LATPLALSDLPEVRGKLIAEAELAPYTWLRVGGPADVLFLPKDEADLAMFLAQKPADLPVFVLGAGSNLLVRDGGISGVVVRLGPTFGQMQLEADNRIRVGAAALDKMLAKFAAKSGIDGLSFYAGIPGTIGGALRMNAGCYEQETKDVLVEAVILDEMGRRRIVLVDELNYSYRQCGAPESWIFVEAVFAGSKGVPADIESKMARITARREQSQPIREKTGGSTFRNPPGEKSWQLIDAAGGRGLKVGGAQMSTQHCNFMINTGNASAADLEALGTSIQQKVRKKSGIELHWEIKRVGRAMGKKIAVLMGGMSPERQVSLDSGKACAEALRRKGWQVVEIDAGHDLAQRLLEIKPDMVFNALHGIWGEDGRVQGLLDYMNLPYTHSGVAASALAMDKQKTKAVLELHGIACPKGQLANRFEAAKAHLIPPPYVAKPNANGSSVGVLIVPEGANSPPLELASEQWPYGDEVLIEEYVAGREFTVAVMEDRALCVTEIIANREFYNYEAKYENGGSTHICPADIDPDFAKIMMDQACIAHRVLGCRGVTRSDFRWDEKNNSLRLLEINTQPGMTATSLVPEQAVVQKIEFDDLVQWMADHANVPTQIEKDPSSGQGRRGKA
jgi:UDP-N-acetylenolpyruvoylglucosamine reductase